MVIELEVKSETEQNEGEKMVNLGGRPRLYGDIPTSRKQIRLPDEVWHKLKEKYNEAVTPSDLIYALANDVLTR